MKKLLPLLLCTATSSMVLAQDVASVTLPKKNNSFYISWGYNKDWFSKSDIHFEDPGSQEALDKGQNDSYDFTVQNVSATDRPRFEDIFQTDLAIPQYSYRIGYFNNQGWGAEINFDHTKYVMDDYQHLHVKGMIHGQYIDQDTTISPMDFIHFEHTNGANFLMLNIMKKQQFLHSKNNKHRLNAVVKFGAGTVIPKSDVTLFGERIDNCFHIAGYVAGAEIGLRYEAFKYVFLEYTAKGVFANYTKVLTVGTGRANHHFWAFENILLLGFQVPF